VERDFIDEVRGQMAEDGGRRADDWTLKRRRKISERRKLV
jgi:hypothetical protein